MKKIQQFLLVKSIGFYINLLSFINLDKAEKLSYKLFSQPRKGRINKNNLPKSLITSTQESFEYKNETIQSYRWDGNDEVIMLIHGWESNSSRWEKLLTYLIPLGKTIVAIDAPAHGLSSGKEFNAPKYADFIEVVTQKHQPKYIIGHSVGGATISYYLYKFNNPSIEKVVLLGSPSDFKILSNNYVSLLSLNNKVKSSLENLYYQKFNIHIDDFKGHYFAKNFTQQVLIAHDVDDTIVLIDESKKYASSWKNAEYIETKGLGHSLHDVDLYQKISDFLAQKK